MSFIQSMADISVVLVEPSSLQARLIQERLHEQGIHNIHLVESGAEALALLENNLINLVISSMYLKDMTGAELVGKMRQNDDFLEIAFMLISSETRPHILDPVRQSGASAILPKPFDGVQLQTALRATMEFLAPDKVNQPVFEEIKVLIVDDSRSARNFIRHVLEQLGMQDFVEAENGKDARDLLMETYVDLVVTDYNMPEMDGHELTSYIREQSWQGSVPILMVSSEQDEGRLAAVQKAGVSAICDKPFHPAQVRDIVMRILQGED